MGKPIMKVWDDTQQKYVSVPAVKGDKGDKGDTYTLTAADKQEIAELVLTLIQDGTEVSY